MGGLNIFFFRDCWCFSTHIPGKWLVATIMFLLSEIEFTKVEFSQVALQNQRVLTVRKCDIF